MNMHFPPLLRSIRPTSFNPSKEMGIILLAITAAVISGFVVSRYQTIATMMLLGLIVGIWAALLIFWGRREYFDIATLAILIALLVLPMLAKVGGPALSGPLQLAILPIALGGVPSMWRASSQDRMLRAGLWMFIAFLAWGAIASIFGRSLFLAATYQLVSDLKPILLIALGYRMAWQPKTEKIFWAIAHWLWLPVIAFILFEWAMPSVYYALFPGSGGISADSSGLLPSRAVGIFAHPSILANTMCAFALICFARCMAFESERVRYFLLGLAYVAGLIASASRGEQLALMFALTLVGALAVRRLKPLEMALIGGIFLLALIGFWDVFVPTITKEAGYWGFGTVGAINHPRAQIFAGSAHVARQYFPFGSGFGTYGGAGAEKFDLSLYDKLGFSNYWWYLREDYLMDTYWPNSIAETGYVGALLLFLTYLFLGISAMLGIKRAPNPWTRTYFIIAAGGIWYMIGNSPTSPVFQDSTLFFFFAIFFGIAHRSAATHGSVSRP